MNHANVRAPFAIISADLPTYAPAQSLERNHALAEELRAEGFEPIACEGCYAGRREMSWIVPLSSSVAWIIEIDQLQALARAFDQESILYVAFSGRATLLFDKVPAHDKVLGVWREVSSVDGFDAYTQIGGRYYVAS